MKVREFQAEDSESLFVYWQRLGEKIPYFLPVTFEHWLRCMFEDRLDNEKKFLHDETFLAEDNEQIIGFAQYGQPSLAWDEKGHKYQNPQIGVLRHFYFEADRLDAANLLYTQCEPYLNQFHDQHAFYHILGMSCNAHHGKLYEKLNHVNQFLGEKGFRVEHENQYYRLRLQSGEQAYRGNLHIVWKPASQPDLREYEIFFQGRPIGMIEIRTLEELTGGASRDIAYMTWIGIESAFRRKGWGRAAMKLLIETLRSEGFKQLHTDTASTNEIAREFYANIGFEDLGRTRSFVRTIR